MSVKVTPTALSRDARLAAIRTRATKNPKVRTAIALANVPPDAPGPNKKRRGDKFWNAVSPQAAALPVRQYRGPRRNFENADTVTLTLTPKDDPSTAGEVCAILGRPTGYTGSF